MVEGSTRHRSRLALSALVGAALAGAIVPASGCRGRSSRPAKVPFATQVAYGRPDACPEDAVDPYGDGTPSPMDLRCSYTDGTGAVLTRVHGRVLFEGPPGSPGESAGRVTVVLHRAPRALGQPLGPELARVVTEPQGTFTLGAMLRAGELVLVVADPDGGPPLLQQRIVVGGDAGHHLADVRLVIPRPLDDEAFPSEPAAEASEPAAFPSEPAPRPQP